MTTPTPSSAPDAVPTPWSDPLARAGARAGQMLMIAAVAVGAVWLLQRVMVVVVAVLVASILAAAVSPLVSRLIAKGWPPLAATVVAFLGIAAMATAVLTGVLVAFRAEWDTLVTAADTSWTDLKTWLASGPLPIDDSVLGTATSTVSDYFSSGELASSTLTGVSAVTEIVTGLVLIAVLLFFLLKDGARIVSFSLRWFHGETRAKLAETIDRSAGVLGGYVRGTAAVALVDAVLIGLGLAVLGVPLAVPLMVIVFIGAFIPVLGAAFAGALAAVVTVVTNGPVDALIVVAVVIAVNQLESNLLQPVVMGRTLSLHPLIVLLALAIGTILGGIVGAILAVPYTAVAWTIIQIWTDRYEAGDDPVLGPDPLGSRDRMANRATASQRVRYQLLRLSRRHPQSLADEHPGEQPGTAPVPSEQTSDASPSPTGSATSPTPPDDEPR